MNWMFPVSAASSLAAIVLSSCGSLRGKSSANGTIIQNPTVTEMQKLETEWGTLPKAPATGTATTATGGAFVPDSTTGAATGAAPAPAASETVTPPAAPAIPPSLR